MYQFDLECILYLGTKLFPYFTKNGKTDITHSRPQLLTFNEICFEITVCLCK